MTRLLASTLGFVGALLLAWAVWVTLRAIARKVWRAGCCARGYHRETVEYAFEWRPDGSIPLPGCFIREPQLRTRCLDCGATRPVFVGIVFTPSRRRTAA